MRMNSIANEWHPDPAEVEHLSLFSLEQHAIVAIGFSDNIESWQVGRAAGFSGGTTTDESKRRANFASAASKATKLNKKVLPHIVALRERLLQFRADGGARQSVSWRQKLERCEWLIRHGTPSESLRAIEMHNRMKGMGDSVPKAIDVVSLFVARVGADATREGFKLLGAGNLVVLVPEVDVVKVEAEALASLNGAQSDFNSRLEQLEARL